MNINDRLKKLLIDYNFTLTDKLHQFEGGLLNQEQYIKECDLITYVYIEQIKIITRWKM